MKFPFYFQNDANNCGPSCLRMISSYYGKNYSLESICEISSFSRVGISMLGISEAAEKLGFRTVGARIEFTKLEDSPLPCIVHWNQHHFVVVYKIEKKRGDVYVHVADPGIGIVTFTQSQFCECWLSNTQNGHDQGLVLFIEPTPDFFLKEPEKKKKSSFLFLYQYFRPYKNLVFQLVLGLILGTLLQLLFPFLTQAIVDIGIKNQSLNFIYIILLAQLMLTLSVSTVGFIRGWILLHLSTRINIALITDFLQKLMKLPINYFDSKSTGDLLQRIGDHERIQNFMTNSTLNILFSMVNVVIFGVILCFYSLQIFFIFLIGSVLYYSWINLFMKKRAQIDHVNFAQSAANQSNVVQLIQGMQEIRLNACEHRRIWEWESIQAKLFDLRMKGLTLAQYQDSGALFINQIKNIIVTFLTAKFVIESQMTLGMMLSVQYILGQLNGPIDQLIVFLRQTQDAKLSLDRLSEVREKEDEEPLGIDKIEDIPKQKNIIMKHVSFAYNTTSVGQDVLHNINLTVESNKQTAIVGMSGSGKTTIVKLLLGYYPVKYGNIYLGDTELSSYSWKNWRQKCGVVMQEGFIFSDTIARNIAPGDDVIDKKKLENAVNIANIKEYIESLPLSYNTKIGSEGSGLSQGQKQRILIARAVYKDPEFIFFDEATNSLDANNEMKIINNLTSFFKNKTVLIVAHRLSTVRNADKIIVMEHGNIVESGKHEELVQLKGVYYNLVKNQLEL